MIIRNPYLYLYETNLYKFFDLKKKYLIRSDRKRGRYILIKLNYFLSLHITTLHCIALAYLDFLKPDDLGNHLKKGILHFTTLNWAYSAVKVRWNIKFAAFCYVFLTLKAGVIGSPLNSSEKIKFERTTSHEQDQEYNFLILRPFKCSFCNYP